MKRIQQIIRGLNRNRLNSGVIIISLAFGMACFFLISVFIQRELNPESFNPDKKRIFALQANNPFGEIFGDGPKMFNCIYGSAEYMKENFAEVESFCRIAQISSMQIKVNGNPFYDQPIVLNASSNFFDFFYYTLLSRNKQTVLETENDIVISKELAIKYFGEEMPLGKSLQISSKNGDKEFFVSGVFERPLAATQINFDMVTLFEGERDSHCYAKLNSPSSRQKMEGAFERLKDVIPVIKGDSPNQYYLLPMNEAYFNSMRGAQCEVTRDKADLWIAAIIAFLILGVAIFNYLNFIKNRLNDHTKTFTINRIHGATNKDLLRLFMGEVFAMMFIALGFGIVLLKLFMPYFNELLTTTITESVFLQSDSLILFVILLGFVLVITWFFVFVHLRTQLSTTNIKGSNQEIRRKINGMNILQLAAMVILVICSSVIIKQIQFINDKEIGMDKNVIVVNIPQAYQNKSEAFRDELAANPNINDLTLASSLPLFGHWKRLLNYNDYGVEKEYYPCLFKGEANFVKTLGIKMLEGEGFSGNQEVDKHKCLINESLANIFLNQELIGKSIPGNPDKTIIGIVEDFHFSSLKRKIEPGIIECGAEGPKIIVKAKEGLENEVKDSIKTIWAKLIPDYPADFEKLEARYKSKHDENKNFIRLIGSGCLISIFLSMMGLFAFSVDKSRKRTKEIGIRKVNGAKVSEILIMLNMEFVKWVVIAFVIATPIAYFSMKTWLENFAYKTTLNWWIFAMAGIIALLIALVTVSWQTFKAARRNPIEALRYE